jgi:hypothetical protein
MAKYVVIGSQSTISSSYKGLAGAAATSGSLRRFRIAEIIIGQSANPNSTDTYVQYDCSRQTVAGTGTSFTPNAEDPADVAALFTALVNYTVEPTVTSNSSIFNVGISQRASFRWQEIDQSLMPVAPATAANGFELRGQSSTYASSVTGQLGIIE